MSATMHAIRQQAFGGPEVLELTEVQRPVPLPTELLVRVRAVGVNPVEAAIRSGRSPLLGEPPFILGWDISGVVEDIEPGVTRLQPGDEVYGMPFFPRPGRGRQGPRTPRIRQCHRQDRAHGLTLASTGRGPPAGRPSGETP
jgi:NADPH:quinone reductase-like Zn-dependent oxidoreductase